MSQEDSAGYDERAVTLVIAIDEHLKSLGPLLSREMRRARSLCQALELQIDHNSPPPSSEVLDHLERALLSQARLLNADAKWLTHQLSQLREHLQSR